MLPFRCGPSRFGENQTDWGYDWQSRENISTQIWQNGLLLYALSATLCHHFNGLWIQTRWYRIHSRIRMDLCTESWSAEKTNFVSVGWFVRQSCTKQRVPGTSCCWTASQCPCDGFAVQFFSTDKKLENKSFERHTANSLQHNSPGDFEQTGAVDRQLGEKHTTIEAFKRATQKSYGHSMIDLDVRNSKTMRYSSNSSGDEPSFFYCSSTDQLYLNLDNEFTKLLYIWFVH